ncbi:MAG: SDR family oxidoreductase [Jatrophihabitans endophyticus]|nr:SDR family oxidoreductase [Jatrophihabitans endophyticus]
MLTGAGGLLGSAFCSAFAADYDIVAVCRRRRPPVPSQHEFFVDPLDPRTEPPENRNRVYVIDADLELDGQVDRVVDVALAKFGRVDLLVNNAAYSRWHAPGLLDGAGIMADFDRHFAVNVGLAHRLTSRLAEQFWTVRDRQNRAANRNVVNVSSLAGARVYPHQGQAVYAASKAALNQLTRHQAAEFAAFGVRVNAVAPNSFPAIVPVESVLAAMRRLDQDQVTGRILAVDAPTPASDG